MSWSCHYKKNTPGYPNPWLICWDELAKIRGHDGTEFNRVGYDPVTIPSGLVRNVSYDLGLFYSGDFVNEITYTGFYGYEPIYWVVSGYVDGIPTGNLLGEISLLKGQQNFDSTGIYQKIQLTSFVTDSSGTASGVFDMTVFPSGYMTIYTQLLLPPFDAGSGVIHHGITGNNLQIYLNPIYPPTIENFDDFYNGSGNIVYEISNPNTYNQFFSPLNVPLTGLIQLSNYKQGDWTTVASSALNLEDTLLYSGTGFPITGRYSLRSILSNPGVWSTPYTDTISVGAPEDITGILFLPYTGSNYSYPNLDRLVFQHNRLISFINFVEIIRDITGGYDGNIFLQLRCQGEERFEFIKNQSKTYRFNSGCVFEIENPAGASYLNYTNVVTQDIGVLNEGDIVHFDNNSIPTLWPRKLYIEACSTSGGSYDKRFELETGFDNPINSSVDEFFLPFLYDDTINDFLLTGTGYYFRTSGLISGDFDDNYWVSAPTEDFFAETPSIKLFAAYNPNKFDIRLYFRTACLDAEGIGLEPYRTNRFSGDLWMHTGDWVWGQLNTGILEATGSYFIHTGIEDGLTYHYQFRGSGLMCEDLYTSPSIAGPMVSNITNSTIDYLPAVPYLYASGSCDEANFSGKAHIEWSGLNGVSGYVLRTEILSDDLSFYSGEQFIVSGAPLIEIEQSGLPLGRSYYTVYASGNEGVSIYGAFASAYWFCDYLVGDFEYFTGSGYFDTGLYTGIVDISWSGVSGVDNYYLSLGYFNQNTGFYTGFDIPHTGLGLYEFQYTGFDTLMISGNLVSNKITPAITAERNGMQYDSNQITWFIINHPMTGAIPWIDVTGFYSGDPYYSDILVYTFSGINHAQAYKLEQRSDLGINNFYLPASTLGFGEQELQWILTVTSGYSYTGIISPAYWYDPQVFNESTINSGLSISADFDYS